MTSSAPLAVTIYVWIMWALFCFGMGVAFDVVYKKGKRDAVDAVLGIFNTSESSSGVNMNVPGDLPERLRKIIE